MLELIGINAPNTQLENLIKIISRHDTDAVHSCAFTGKPSKFKRITLEMKSNTYVKTKATIKI